MEAKDLVPTTINGVLIALSFIVLGMVVAFLNGLLPVSVAIWTIIATVIILPLIGLKGAKMNLQTLTGLGLSIAIVGIIAAIIPQAAFLFDPFTASITGVIGLVAVLLHLGAAIAVSNLVKAYLKVKA